MRENRKSGSEGGEVQTNAPSLPLWDLAVSGFLIKSGMTVATFLQKSPLLPLCKKGGIFAMAACYSAI
jgi:hypothetical protein